MSDEQEKAGRDNRRNSKSRRGSNKGVVGGVVSAVVILAAGEARWQHPEWFPGQRAAATSK